MLVWMSREAGFSKGAARPWANVPDGDIVNMRKPWAVPEGRQRSRLTTVLSMIVKQWISLKLVFWLSF